MNQKSLNRTLQRSAPLRKTTISGWKRVFNAPFYGYAYLNLEKIPSEKKIPKVRPPEIQVAYFTMSQQEFKKFAEREAGSELVEVKKNYFAFVWPQRKCKTLPILKTYIDICDAGALQLDINWFSGTQWPRIIVDDRKNPLY